MILKGLRWLMLLVLLGYGVFVNGFLLAYFTHHDLISIIAQLVHLTPWITLLSVIALVLALIFRSKLVAAWLLPGAVIFFVWYGGNFFPNWTGKPDGVEITVANFNIYGTYSDPQRITEVIRKMDADIVVLEEVRKSSSDYLTAYLIDDYAYRVYQYDYNRAGLALLSRYPIIEHTSDDYKIRSVLDVEGQRVVVYSFHAPNTGFHLGRAYNDYSNRSAMDLMKDWLAAETDPVLMLCDCNSTPQTRQHRGIDEVMDDAFQQVGWGFGFTHEGYFDTILPIVRIDYVWYSPQFTALHAKVWRDDGTSDHHPVIATLVLRGDD